MLPQLLHLLGAHLEVFKFPLLLGELLLRGLDAHDAVRGGWDGDEAAEGVLDRLEPVVAIDAEQVRPGKLKVGFKMRQMVPDGYQVLVVRFFEITSSNLQNPKVHSPDS